MHVRKLQPARRVGFKHRKLHRRVNARGGTAQYLKSKASFFVAAFSLIAFLGGNMLGSHGWYAFWKSVLGAADDSLIAYTGTVSPVKLVPDYTRWSAYGGDSEKHTFRQVPQDLLIPIPAYIPEQQKLHYNAVPAGDIYSIGHMGSYETGAEGEGSHPGVDIRLPEGTPILSIANGIVTRVSNDVGGYGKLIVIRHPHMPDPGNPMSTTVLHSAYAHLSSQLVQEGDIVEKGQQIGFSGRTGFATGPHLHFQIDRDSAPWHPYWPFSSQEVREAGMSTTQAINSGFHKERGYQNTVHPMLYVQANYPSSSQNVATAKGSSPRVASSSLSIAERKSRAVTVREERIRRRKALVAALPAEAPKIIAEQQIAVATQDTLSTASPIVIEFEHDGAFQGRQWEKMRVVLKNEQGGPVSAEVLPKDIVLRTGYGEAEFRPSVLSPLDFENGVAEVQVLPRGRRTLVVVAQPFNVLSAPMVYRAEQQ